MKSMLLALTLCAASQTLAQTSSYAQNCQLSRSGSIRFDSLSTSELTVRIYQSIGVITGRQHQIAREPGAGEQAHPKDVRFTHIYALVDSRWVLVASQITPIAP